ncbi:chromosome transmission fidelity protein 8 homolog isoform X2 [Mangifera indica]|uniref:chromosome transmission fidelity protein 8 homolog isoform X2 n=1 Tax=Mangifera indica TaxID=29780 RepID=UPI001CFA213F|nr:chromosome transmission fidelity protein 8 homolog isoform X2 [Mangifera indica]
MFTLPGFRFCSRWETFFFFLVKKRGRKFIHLPRKQKKMQIRIKCSCEEGSCPDWAIIEVQGVVEVQPSFQDRLRNLEIGQLCRPSSQENYAFTIGYHELTGSKVALKKPILVLKIVQSSDNQSPEADLKVVGIIRHRILFKTRPKALISIEC